MTSFLLIHDKAPAGRKAAEPADGLARDYGVTRLVFLPRGPDWMHAYWEVAPYTWQEAERAFGPGVRGSGRAVLRLYAGGEEAPLDVDIQLPARNWYVRLPGRPGRCRGELGLILPDGRFVLLALSNEIWMPAGRLSERMDEKWSAPDADWARIYELSGGGRRGAGSMGLQRAPAQGWESGPSSRPGSASMPPHSPRAGYGPAEMPRDFRLAVDCELVVHIASAPGARVRLQGREVALRPDGTFSCRLALPAGRLEIPVEAESAGGDMSRAAHLSVARGGAGEDGHF